MKPWRKSQEESCPLKLCLMGYSEDSVMSASGGLETVILGGVLKALKMSECSGSKTSVSATSVC